MTFVQRSARTALAVVAVSALAATALVARADDGDDDSSVLVHRNTNGRVYGLDDDTVETAGFEHRQQRRQTWCDGDSGSCDSCNSGYDHCDDCNCNNCNRGDCRGNDCDGPFCGLFEEFTGYHFHRAHWCWDDCDWRHPEFDIQAGTVIMTRSVPHPTGLAVDSSTGDSLLNAENLRYTWEAGPDISIAHSCGCGESISGRYFRIDEIHAHTSFTPLSGSFDIPMSVPLTETPSGDVDFGYTSRIQSGEFNFGHCEGGRIVWLAGFRWLQLQENMSYQFDTSDTDFNTNNKLYGGQLGMNIRLHDTGGHLFFDGVMKGGVYGNVASNGFSAGDDTGLSETSHDKRTQVAFVGEVGLEGVYQWTRHIATRCGYQVMWLEGVAVASDQVSAVTQNGFDGSGIDTRGGLFYHGATATIEVSW